MSDPPSKQAGLSLLPRVPPLLPPLNVEEERVPITAVWNDTPVQFAINRRAQRMKYKNCGVIITKNYFIKEDDEDMYGDDLIPPLTILEAIITAVPDMQKNCQIPQYQCHSISRSISKVF